MDSDMGDLRVSDDEKETAYEALAAHLRVGRLTVDEYGERAERLNEARTRSQVRELFVDLPEPGPRFEQSTAESPPAPTPREEAEEAAPPVDVVKKEPAPPAKGDRDRRGPARLSTPLGVGALVMLCYVTGNWLFMMFTPVVIVVSESVLRAAERRR